MKDGVNTATTLFPDSHLTLTAGTMPDAHFAHQVNAAEIALEPSRQTINQSMLKISSHGALRYPVHRFLPEPG